MNLKFSLVFLLFFSSLVYSNVEIKYFVNDYAGVLSNDEIFAIEDYAKQIFDSGKAQYAIVIIDSLNGSDIESYSLGLVQNNLGNEQNNGLLLLISVQDRQYRIEVGRGLEPILNDAKVGRIARNYLVPYLKYDNYGEGIFQTTLALQQELQATTSETVVEETDFTFMWIILIIFFIIAILTLRGFMKGGKGVVIFMGRGGGSGGRHSGGFGGGSFGGGGSSGRF